MLGMEKEEDNRDSQGKGDTGILVKGQLGVLYLRRVFACYYGIGVFHVRNHSYCLSYKIFFSSRKDMGLNVLDI